MHYPCAAFDRLARWCLPALFFLIPVSLAGANIALALTIACWLLSGRFSETWQQARSHPMTWPLLGLYAVILLGAVYTPAGTDDVFNHWLKYSKLPLIVVVGALLADPTTRERSWIAFTSAMLLTLVLSYLNIWLDLPFTKTHNQGWGENHAVFKDHIVQGVMMALFMVRALQNGWLARVPWQRWFWWAIAVAAFICNIQLSTGRTGYLATGVALSIFILAAVKPHMRAVAVLGLLAALVVAVSTSQQLQQRVQLGVQEIERYKEDRNEDRLSSIGQRMYFSIKSIELTMEKPLLGWGTGAYHEQYCRVAASVVWCDAGKFHPHNQMLFFAVEHGVLGLLMFLAVFAAALWTSRGFSPSAKAVAWAYLAIFFTGSITHGSLWLSSESLFYAFTLALVMAASRRPVAALRHS